jgi:dipeptidyl aminopeptidase/acylaminoacyl peptidase
MKTKTINIIILMIFTLFSYAQSGKVKLTPSDFEKWGRMTGELISPDGKWASCKMEYDSGKDTIFVINTITAKIKHYPGAVSITFSKDSQNCVIKYPVDSISILDFKTNKLIPYSNVKRFDFISEGNYLLLVETDSKKKLQLFDNKNKLQWQVENVIDYSLGKNNMLALILDNGVSIMNLQTKAPPVQIIAESQSKFSCITWNLFGNSIALFSQSNTSSDSVKIFHHDFTNGTTNVLRNVDIKFKGTPFNIELSKMVLSKNDKQVYLLITEIEVKENKEKIVEVWDSETLYEYPEQEILEDPETHPYLIIWNVDSGKLQKLDDADYINTKILPDGLHAVSISKTSMVSLKSEFVPADYYSTNLLSGDRTLIASQLTTASGIIKVSPSGRYLCYFKEGFYYIFDNRTGKTSNITASIPVDFNNVEFDRAGSNPGYKISGWTSDSQYVILNDQFDIWLFSPEGKAPRKITNGRSSKTQFRIELERNDMQFDDVAQLSWETINIQEGILISALGKDYSSGFYLLKDKEGLKKICYGKYKTSKLTKAKKTGLYLYNEETSEQPPRLMFKDKSKASHTIFQSNKQYVNYKWPTSELINYTNSRGDSLQGILMYPSDYRAGKKYPMIVYIYERLSKTFYDYINPVSSNAIGFSPTAYLHDDYFVLMPDIRYEIGIPGLSAVDCVTSAVKSVVKKNLIEENHVGLLGHSWGGFQTAFIITKTSIFAAAVAGGAVTDPVSSYLSINFERFRSANWRYEDQQFRMQSSPLNNWEGYIKNSTIAHAANITTPLLSWNGKKDASVNFEQGLELHFALRALQKENIFLLYPEQGHLLTNQLAMNDLTNRIKNWFDKYLKNK